MTAPHHADTRPTAHRGITIALDSFKGSISASDACRALAAGWRAVDARARLLLRPMADGGEGTLEAIEAAAPGALRMPVTVTGPSGTPVETFWLALPDGIAAVELARTSGIELLGDQLLPWRADTRGFGEAIRAALASRPRRLVLGIGSSASTDAGLGLLIALGARFLDTHGAPMPPGAEGLGTLAKADLSDLAPLPPDGVTVLTDVTAPLFGPGGAAFGFGPQKGLQPAECQAVDALLRRVAGMLPADPLSPGAGAAGGAGFALLAWGAQLESGAAHVIGLTGFRAAAAESRLIVTGEGRFDRQSLTGKAPGAVLGASGSTPVALVAGAIDPQADVSGFQAAISLSALAGSGVEAQRRPAAWLEAAGSMLAESVMRDGQ